MSEKNKDYKKFILLLSGTFILILGITLNLLWWEDFVRLGKGGIGFVLSLAGLLTLYAVNKK